MISTSLPFGVFAEDPSAPADGLSKIEQLERLPENPGDVKVIKEVEEVKGKVNTYKVNLSVYERDYKKSKDTMVMVENTKATGNQLTRDEFNAIHDGLVQMDKNLRKDDNQKKRNNSKVALRQMISEFGSVKVILDHKYPVEGNEVFVNKDMDLQNKFTQYGY